MKKILLSGMIALLCLAACDSNHSFVQLFVTISEKDIVQISDSIVPDIVDSVFIIPLEETQGCLLGDIRKIQRINNEFYVMAQGTSRLPEIFRFGHDGSFLNKIGNLGNSRGEYVRIGSFLVVNDKVYVADLNKNKILVYNVNGEFIDYNENNDNVKFIHDMIAINNNRALFSYDINFSDNNALFDLVDLNSFKTLNTISTTYKSTGSFPYSMKEMNLQGEDLLLSLPFENSIYKLDTARLALDKVLSPALWGNIPSFNSNDYDEIQRTLEESETSLLCGFFVSGNKILLNSVQSSILWYTDLGKGLYWENGINLDKIDTFPFFPLSVYFSDEDGFYSVFSADDFMSIMKNISSTEHKDNSPQNKNAPRQKYKNPVIVKYKIKSL